MLKKVAAFALVFALAAPAFAQNPATPGLDKRQDNMEKRLEQGKATGALNEKEAARLDKRKASLSQAEERAKADGAVTAQERKHLDKKADKLSKDIHSQKHDAQKAVPAVPAIPPAPAN